MFRLLGTALSLSLIVLLAAPRAAPVRYFVSSRGDDAGAGTKSRPFATLEHALEAARQRGTAGTRITLLRGTHTLTRTIELGPDDSGLTVEGRGAVLSGGRRVTGWKPWKGEILQADLGGLGLPDLDIRELYFDAELMQWARTPNFDAAHPRTGGFLSNERIAEPGTATKFVYPAGSLHPELWSHPERAWITFHDAYNYETQLCPVRSIDRDQRMIEAERGVYALAQGSPFHVSGVLEELDAPGEWCVDPDTATLYFWPPSGNPDGARAVVVPALASAFVLRGDAAGGRFVEDVRLSRLALRDFRGRAVQVTGARSCAVVACDIRNAETGVYIGDDTHACRVAGCDITQTQGDGVTIVGSSMDHERVSDHVVDNCHIWDIGWGRIHNRCGGVYMHRCARVKLTHNHVHDTPRYALAMDAGNDCEFAWNHCHDANLVTADTGIIEAATALDWGLPIDEQIARNAVHNAGNSIHHNVLHGSGGWGPDSAGRMSGPYFSWGIYLDLAASNWRVHDNVVFDTVLGAFMGNGVVNVAVENNVFVDGKENQVFFNPWPGYPISGNRCERNVVAYRGSSAAAYTLPGFADTFARFERNLVWADGETPIVSSLPDVKRPDSWAAWLGRGQDAGTVLADPRFVRPSKRDYRLRATSPALQLGFVPFDLRRAGNYAGPDRRTRPRRDLAISRDAMDYTPGLVATPQPRERTYEDTPVGGSETGAGVWNDGAGLSAVTGETAARGAHSLKFTDAPGLAAFFYPFVTYSLVQDQGSLHMSFDLRWETGALMALDWRNDPLVYDLGPNLSTTAAGVLIANGVETLTLPAGQWVHIEIDCGLGLQATGKYDLAVTLPGGQPQAFHDVACSPNFKSLDVIVFMSLADASTAFYVDDLVLEPRAAK